jgi:hypothetical protein
VAAKSYRQSADCPPNKTNGNPAAVALTLLDEGFRPVVVYPPGFPRQKGPAKGKEPFGKGWGIKDISPETIAADVRYFTSRNYVPGVGVCLGPTRAPGGGWLVDIEGDGPEAEASREKLFAGEVVESRGWGSTRGGHRLHVADGERLAEIVPRLKGYEKKGANNAGVFKFPQLPGLEFRMGGFFPDGKLKQVQSVVPPTPGTDDKPREWNGVETIAELPGSFYANLERIANEPPPNPADAYLKAALAGAVKRIEGTGEGERRNRYRDEAYNLAGWLHYNQKFGIGYTERELEDTLKSALAIGVQPGDRVVDEAVSDAIAAGKAKPQDLKLELHQAAAGATRPKSKSKANPSSNGDRLALGPRQAAYDEHDGCLIVTEDTDDGPKTTVLANFTARIVAQVERHEQGEVRRQYQIEATHSDGSTGSVLVDAENYDAMGWVGAGLGAEWSISAGRSNRDHARAGIQRISHRNGITRAVVHTSLGWIKHEGQNVYLHARGGIGAGGETDAVRVDVDRALSRYALPNPAVGEGEIRAAIRARLRLLDLAKPHRPSSGAVAAVLMAQPARAVLGPADFSVHFSGGTGDYKSSSAKIGYQHFAIGVVRRDKLPASWNSTLGSLQRYAFDAGDTLLVIDELTGEAAVAVATEFTQCQGNLKGRDRMDKHFRIAPSLDPRGSVLSTGEADPTRQSSLGRMLTVRFTPATIDLAVLSACQKDAADGLYALAMAAFIRWLAHGDRLDNARRDHVRAVDEIADQVRALVKGSGVHSRHPEIVAELIAGHRLFLRFATESKLIGQEAADESERAVAELLTALLLDQGEIQAEASPAQRFLSLLRAGLQSKRYILHDANSDAAPEPYAGACGWHKDWVYQGQDGQSLEWKIPPNSKLVGHIDLDAERVYILPEMAKTVATTMAREQGRPFENVVNIGRELADAKLIVTEKEKSGKVRNTVSKRIRNYGKDRYITIPTQNLFGPARQDE